MLDRFDALDRRLVAAGFPATSPWWRSTLGRLYGSGARQAVLRVGRRGGKSSTLCRVAVLEALYGEHVIPPGDVGIVGIVSVSRDEAAQRLRTIKAILDAIGVAYKPIDGGIELADRPVAFKVFTASIAGVVGGTWIFGLCDEVARWRDADTGANPATEVLASLRPTMATQPRARLVLSSSPLGTLDAHAEAFALGDTERQIVAYAPTWVANPTVTEADTRALESDERKWRREYLGEPQSGAMSAFDPDAIDAAFAQRTIPPTVVAGAPLIVIDASSGRADAWTWARCRWILPPSTQYQMVQRYAGQGRYYWDYVTDARGQYIELKPDEYFAPTLSFEAVEGVEGSFWKQGPAVGEQIVERIAAECRKYGATRVVGDQREALMLSAAFARRGIPYTSLAWTAPTKELGVATVRRWLRDRQIILPAHEKLRRELAEFEEKITPSGAITFGARGSKHDDYVALLITAAMSDANGLISLSPMKKTVTRIIPDGWVA